jgi:hypothetical protein
LLQRQFDALMAREFKWYEDSDETDPGSYYNLELLTALRRAKKQPDPLTILVQHGGGPLAGTPLSLPRLKVSIKNVDLEQEEVGFTFGGDYRSGRQARWRLAVVNDKGRVVPRKQVYGMIYGGGQFTEGTLKHGESWETTIDMREFIESPAPGRYEVQVLYHNTRTILFSDDISGLIVSRSEKMPLVVAPTVIELTEKQRRLANDWIAALEPTEPYKVVAGTYGKWAHNFIRPESPAGKLLSNGLKSAPPLVEALRNETMSVEKRAWILSLLYSVTGLNDPCQRSALGSYECAEGPWQVWGSGPGEAGSGGIGLPSTRSCSTDGKINVDDQKLLAKQWFEWLKTVEVKTAEDSHLP